MRNLETFIYKAQQQQAINVAKHFVTAFEYSRVFSLSEYFADDSLTCQIVRTLLRFDFVTRTELTAIACVRLKREYQRSNNNTTISAILSALCVQNVDKSYSLATIDVIRANAAKSAFQVYLQA